jgi:hypothetical protein
MKFIWISFAASFLLTQIAFAKDVVVIGTIHGDHKRFPLYNFDTLKIVLEHIKPDILFIEEDPKTFKEALYKTLSEEEYGKIRPIEIKKVLMPYAEENKIKVVPTDSRVGYDEKIKTQYDGLGDDPFVDAVQYAYMSLFMDNYLTTSIYDFHSEKFMAVLEGRELIYNAVPKYKKLRELDTMRQMHINRNVIEGIDKNDFKIGVVVYGVSHRPAIIRALIGSGSAKILSLEEAMKSRIDPLFKRKVTNIYK